MSACTKTFLLLRGQPRHSMGRPLNALRATLLGLLIAACADSRSPTVAGPQPVRTQAGIDASNGATSSAADFDAGVPIAYYQLSLTFTKRTAGITPPVQSRAFAYMGLALYEALVAGMPNNQSVANQLHGIGALPEATGIPYNWALVANASLAEVVRGLWGDKTNQAAANIADVNALEARFASQYSGGVPPGIAMLSRDFGKAAGAAVYATSRDDGGDEGYLTNFPTNYVPPTGPGLWVPTAPGQLAMQPFWAAKVATLALSSPSQCDRALRQRIPSNQARRSTPRAI